MTRWLPTFSGTCPDHARRASLFADLEHLRPLTKRAIALDALRRPLQSQRLHLAIYWQAARLFLKRVRFHPHPRKLAGAAGKPAPTDHVRIPHS